MRIALIPSSYAPATGGVEQLSRTLAEQLLAAGHALEVWTGNAAPGHLPAQSVLDGVTVRRFAFPLPSGSWSAAASALPHVAGSLAALRAASRRFAPDVLNVHCFGPNGAYAAALSRIERLPLVVSLHGETLMDDQDIFEHSTTLRLALRGALRCAGAVTACSRFAAADAEARFGLRPGTARVVYNAVELDERRAAAVPGWAAPFGRYVLALGRVVEKKGFDLLLRAFADVAPAHRGVGLVVGGDGPARPGLERLAAELGLGERVHFAGRLERAGVQAAMAHAEVFVMPSRLEPFGIVVLEAWRAGCAVVASTRGGAPEFVRHGVDGLLVDPLDTVALARVLGELLADPEHRSALAAAGRRRVEAFGWPDTVAAYVASFEEAMRRAPTRLAPIRLAQGGRDRRGTSRRRRAAHARLPGTPVGFGRAR